MCGTSLLLNTFHENPLHVSLTTTKYRVANVHRVIKSLLCQYRPPTRVHLYVSNTSFYKDQGIHVEDLKHVYKLYESNCLEIHFVPNIGPHRKLWFLLEANKNNKNMTIVTIDDDHIIDNKWLNRLLKCHTADSNGVVNGRISKICYDCQNKITVSGYGPKCKGDKFIQIPTGVSGVLYKPSFFDKIIFEEKFLSMAPLGDDLSFRFATFIKNTSIVKCDMKGIKNVAIKHSLSTRTISSVCV